MPAKLQIISIIGAIGLFGLVFELVRRKRLMERYALLWLFASVLVLGLAVWGDALETLSRLAGVAYGPSALFAVALGFVLVLLLHFSLVISRLADQSKVLAQRVAILQARLEAHEASGAGAPAENGAADAPRRAGVGPSARP
jgi:hypothetical protein